MGKTFPTAPVTMSRNEREVVTPTNRTGQSSSSTIATATSSIIQHVQTQSAQAVSLKRLLVYGSPHSGLDDPHFRDLSTVPRYYLYCFGTDIHQSLVLYNMSGMNPFQSLVQYAEHHELLRQIIIAMATVRLM